MPGTRPGLEKTGEPPDAISAARDTEKKKTRGDLKVNSIQGFRCPLFTGMEMV